MREKINFDRSWYFHKGDIKIPYAVKAGRTGGYTDCEKPEHGEWLEIAYSDSFAEAEMNPKEWQLIDLPHDWAIEGNYMKDYPKGRAHLPIGIGCYRKIFTLPEADRGRKIALHFDGVMRHCTLWINGHLIGTHASGHTSFEYDVTDVLRYGEEGRNAIFIKVDASEYEGWWYDGCGIYRHVWMVKTDRVHVKQWGTCVRTPSIRDESADVWMETIVLNECREAADVRLVTEIMDPLDRIAARAESLASLDGDGEQALTQELSVPSPMLWHPDHPHLYRAVSTVYVQGEIVDVYETSFGIRSIAFTSDRGFLLNGEPLLIKGVCVHQDFAGVGSALPDRLHAYKIELLKEMGTNAYRTAHHPAAPELLDACDRLGMLVMEENRKLDSSPDGLANLRSMLLRDRNRPSIILWSMENEEVIEGTPIGTRILDTLARTTRKLDPTRPVTASVNHGFNSSGYSEAVDIVGYNYGHYDDNRDIRDHEQYPDRIIIGSESASYTTTRGIYASDDEKGYCSSYGTKLASWCCSPEKVWSDVMENRFLTGTFIWTGFDYKGEPTPYNWPTIGSHFGIMDSCGFPKPIYYYFKSVWTDEPTVHLFPHWNWHGKEGELVEVWVYSNCDTVELLVNGQSAGIKPRVDNGHLEWHVPYAAGKIIAKGYNGGVETAVHEVATTEPPYQIRLEPDRDAIAADGSDVSVLRVSVCDRHGRVVPTADPEIRFSVAGPGTLIGVGNGDPSSHESDKAPYRRAFNGYALALMQSTGGAGSITVTAASTGLVETKVVIAAK